MIRRVQLSLNEANAGKLHKLDLVMTESMRVLNDYVDVLWAGRSISKFTPIDRDTWLSARMRQCLLKQAAETVKSQRALGGGTKPSVTGRTLNLDERFLKITDGGNTFDLWIRFASLGDKIRMSLPACKHKHMLKYSNAGWAMRKSGRLRHNSKGWFLDIYMEKVQPAFRTSGTEIGLDTGYRKLLACSDGKIYDAGLPAVYTKITRRRRGSTAYARALSERDQLINRSVNSIDLTGVKTLVVENLKSVKHKSKGRFLKEFNSKLAHWSYPGVLNKLQLACEERGINFIKVDPAYTSQTCSSCGRVDGESRKGETFRCTGCGMLMDADINAAKNILMRGTYSPPSVKTSHEIPF